MPGDSKTEKASPKKRKDERKKGNIFQSKDIVTIASVLAIFIGMKFYFPIIYERITFTMTSFVESITQITLIDNAVVMDLAWELALLFGVLVLPIAFFSILVTIIATGSQTRFLVAFEALKPKFSKLNPISGFKKMFSLKSLVEVFKGLLKISIIGYLMYDFFMNNIEGFSKLYDYDIISASVFTFDLVFQLVINLSIVFAFIAALDYLYQWWDYERQIKMSKQEVKEEYKQLEGDPQVKGKIKQQQQKMAMSRMMQAVPSADVIIRNPTHYAVALKYDIKKNNAPIVIAKGQDELALRIIDIATKAEVSVVENPPIARAIYSTTELNKEISYEFFNVVAQILAVIYEEKNKDIKKELQKKNND